MAKSLGQIAYEACMKILMLPANWESLQNYVKLEWESTAKNFVDKLNDYANES